MNILEIVRFAIRGLVANRLRSSLTTLGILIGVGSVIILVAVGNGSSKQIQNNIEKLGTNTIMVQRGGGGFGPSARNRQGSSKPLTIADAVALSDPKKAPNIKQVAPIASASSTCTNGRSEEHTSELQSH